MFGYSHDAGALSMYYFDVVTMVEVWKGNKQIDFVRTLHISAIGLEDELYCPFKS